MGSMAKVQYWDHFPATMDHSNPANAAENEYQWTEELYTCAGCGREWDGCAQCPCAMYDLSEYFDVDEPLEIPQTPESKQ